MAWKSDREEIVSFGSLVCLGLSTACYLIGELVPVTIKLIKKWSILGLVKFNSPILTR